MLRGNRAQNFRRAHHQCWKRPLKRVSVPRFAIAPALAVLAAQACQAARQRCRVAWAALRLQALARCCRLACQRRVSKACLWLNLACLARARCLQVSALPSSCLRSCSQVAFTHTSSYHCLAVLAQALARRWTKAVRGSWRLQKSTGNAQGALQASETRRARRPAGCGPGGASDSAWTGACCCGGAGSRTSCSAAAASARRPPPAGQKRLQVLSLLAACLLHSRPPEKVCPKAP